MRRINKIKFLGNYYGHSEGHTGSVYHRKGIKPTIVAIDWKAGKGLVCRKYERKQSI